MGAILMMVVAMRKLKIFTVAVPLVAFPVFAPAAAQEYGRLLQVQYVDQFYSGRIDGRPNHNEGLPPTPRTREIESTTIRSVHKIVERLKC
jgi:hypothetical protein